MEHREQHRIQIGNWLRAAVLGANDGIVSTASLVLGVAAADVSQQAVVTTGIAGLVAGSLSMAVGEYISVSSQRDIERADLAREATELQTEPDKELDELTSIYISRGLSSALARQVAVELTEGGDALRTHARDELHLDIDALAQPVQAAAASALSFAIGSALPLASIVWSPESQRDWMTGLIAGCALAVTGAASAALSKAPMLRATTRVVIGGIAAMALTSLIGSLFKVSSF